MIEPNRYPSQYLWLNPPLCGLIHASNPSSPGDEYFMKMQTSRSSCCVITCNAMLGGTMLKGKRANISATGKRSILSAHFHSLMNQCRSPESPFKKGTIMPLSPRMGRCYFDLERNKCFLKVLCALKAWREGRGVDTVIREISH